MTLAPGYASVMAPAIGAGGLSCLCRSCCTLLGSIQRLLLNPTGSLPMGLARRSAYPQYVLHVLTQAVERAGLSEIREDKLLGAIAQLNKAVGESLCCRVGSCADQSRVLT